MSDLDRLVAEGVFGTRMLTLEEMQAEAARVWEQQPSCRRFHMGFVAWQDDADEWHYEQIVKPYSTDIAAAWEIVEKLPDSFTLDRYAGWRATVGDSVSVAAHSAPLAICLVAIKAIGAGVLA